MATDETRALARIRAAAAAAVRKRGLVLLDMVIKPAETEDGPTPMTLVVAIDPNALPERTGENDDAFEQVLADAKRAEQEANADAARESLSDLSEKLRQGREEGIL